MSDLVDPFGAGWGDDLADRADDYEHRGEGRAPLWAQIPFGVQTVTCPRCDLPHLVNLLDHECPHCLADDRRHRAPVMPPIGPQL